VIVGDSAEEEIDSIMHEMLLKIDDLL